MRELARSMASFSWAMSLFGVEQMTNLLAPHRAVDAFGAMARSAEGVLGPRLRSAFQTGDRLQRSVMDLSFGLVGLGPSARRGDTGQASLKNRVGSMGFELLQLGTDTVYWMTGTAWQQQQGVSGWGPIPPLPEAARET